ncbi:MAG TPA: hypothetical protein VN843_10820, partial [Anaerolineales bacterium]|nr:hypothetical protein [Anaerolineales bacterium]
MTGVFLCYNSPIQLQITIYSFMNHIWSPWRMEYIENHNKPDGCVFCIAQAMDDSAENLIAHRGEHSYVILNRYPYTSGHL